MPRSSPEDIFHEARQMKVEAERGAYLKGACGGDLGLRSKVDALLRADADAGAFLASDMRSGITLDEVMGKEVKDEQLGAMLGRYKLLQKIGEGGFGVVFLAEQKEPVKRRVALKVIKLGMDTRQVIARFEAERQALAMMDHHHIAKVLDAGATDSGRPYFVMELVKGIPITDYCDQNKLTVEERLGLFVQVCHAVQHAHQKGIIHRDIKPSNVLVTLHDGVPVPKVIDFGIAKATSAELAEKTLFTEHGQMIGTPVYMSPEQAELSGLDIDTRSDIYSLGVLLYELLTGTTPFTIEALRAAGFAEMRRMIREKEPQKPSTRLSSIDTLPQVASHRGIEPRKLGLMIRGDLDWIIMRALKKDRARRYETANSFAADLDRFLADEPVHASPPSASYRMHKFVRRNRKGVIAGAAMAAVLLIAAGVSIHFGLQESRQRRIAENAQVSEARQRQVAEDALAGESRERRLAVRNSEQLVTANEALVIATERAE